jgi:hypothetical protein
MVNLQLGIMLIIDIMKINMSIIDKLHNLQGVKVFLERNAPNVNIYNERKLNDFFMEFAKDMGWEKEFVPTRKYTKRYSPAIDNVGIIQGNWKEFKKWVKQKQS